MPYTDEQRALLIQRLREDQRKALSGVDEQDQTRASAQWVVRVLREQFEEWRRETAILFEELLRRLDGGTGGVAAQPTNVDALNPHLSIQIKRIDGKFDGLETRLSQKLDRTDAKLDIVLARLERLVRDQQ